MSVTSTGFPVVAGQFVRLLVPAKLQSFDCPAGYMVKVISVDGESLYIERDLYVGANKPVRGTVSVAAVEPAYVEVGGTFYDYGTAPELLQLLERLRTSGTRVHVHYGYTEKSARFAQGSDKVVGEDWLEEFQCEGRIGRSMGPVRIPLMIVSSRSFGGGGLSSDNIVKITTTTSPRRVLWQHPQYHHGKVTIREIGPDEMVGKENLRDKGYTHAADVGGSNHANFKSLAAAERWVKKMGLKVWDARAAHLNLDLEDDWVGSFAQSEGVSFVDYLQDAADDSRHALQDAARELLNYFKS
jgi:hypothetical protein